MILTPQTWIESCNRMVRARDLDNVVLLTGEPGNGKSTLMFQIGHALDPLFSLERIHFTIPEFLEDARGLDHYRAVAADELLMNRRHSMRRESIEMLDFLQVCRGMNLHMLLCFPNANRLDRAVIEDRVRYMIDVPKQGLAVLHERKQNRQTGQVFYPEILKWKFDRNSGPKWEDYLAKKLLMARQRDSEARGFGSLDEEMALVPIQESSRKKRRPRKDRVNGKPSFAARKLSEAVARTGKHPEGCGKTFPCPTGACGNKFGGKA